MCIRVAAVTLYLQYVCLLTLPCPVGHFTGVLPRSTELSRGDSVGSRRCGWYDGTIVFPLVLGVGARGRTGQIDRASQLHRV